MVPGQGEQGNKFLRAPKSGVEAAPPPQHWSHSKQRKQRGRDGSVLLSLLRMAAVTRRRGSLHGMLRCAAKLGA